MRFYFRETPWDLYFIGTYSLFVTALLLGLGAGVYFALPLVLFVPGYVVTSALFPRDEDIEWVERWVLSLGTSLGVVPLLGLVLAYSQLGLRFGALVLALTAFSLVINGLAIVRRLR